MRTTVSNPSPVPSPTGLVVKNGSKMRDLRSAGYALSRYHGFPTRTSVGSLFVRTFNVPPSAMASTALTIRLVHNLIEFAAIGLDARQLFGVLTR